jgi:hypothetical protein
MYFPKCVLKQVYKNILLNGKHRTALLLRGWGLVRELPEPQDGAVQQESNHKSDVYFSPPELRKIHIFIKYSGTQDKRHRLPQRERRRRRGTDEVVGGVEGDAAQPSQSDSIIRTSCEEQKQEVPPQ